MASPKQILILNSGCRLGTVSVSSEEGEHRLHFREITHLSHLTCLQDVTFDDVVWVRRLSWKSKHREEIEHRIQARITRSHIDSGNEW